MLYRTKGLQLQNNENKKWKKNNKNMQIYVENFKRASCFGFG